MKALTPTEQNYQKVSELFLWAKQRHFTYYFTGEWKRWGRTERALLGLVRKGALTAVRHGKELVYSVGNKRANNTADIEHGLISTECLLRIKVAQEGEFVPESFFRAINLGSVPEWGFMTDKSLLLYEYGTADNFRRTQLMKKKVKTYGKVLGKFRDYFERDPIVLFVFDAEQYRVKYFVEKYGRHERFFFCDLASFKSVRLGKQLVAPIYYWMDGERHSLS
jgi:hypothetical protein